MAFLDDIIDGASNVIDDVTDFAGDAIDTIGNVIGAANTARISKNPPHQDYNASEQIFGLGGDDGFDTYNTPKMKFSFVVEFILSQKAQEFVNYYLNNSHNKFKLNSCSFVVKETGLPSASFSTDYANQYNKNRLTMGKLKYNPVALTFYDTVDSVALLLLDAYKKYYYGDFYRKTSNSWKYDVLTTEQNYELTDTNWGKSVQNVGNFDDYYFFKQINIYEIDGDRYTCHNMFNPQLESYTLDTKSHDSTGEPALLTYNLLYEGIGNLGPDGRVTAISAPTLEIANLLTNTDLLGKGGFYKLYGEMDDKSVGTSIGDMIRGGAAVVDIFNGVKDILDGDADADTIRNLGGSIVQGAKSLDLGGTVSDISDKFGLGSIFGD